VVFIKNFLNYIFLFSIAYRWVMILWEREIPSRLDQRDLEMAIGKRTGRTKSGEIRRAWVVRYRDPQGNYRQRAFKLRRDAEAWVAHINAETG
jgi:hypothetical protein